MTSERRGRGRPPTGDAADRRAAILDAARSLFAAKGFGAASLRAIAREAGVDVSLISHYFGDKSQLLVATLQLPVDPTEKIASAVADGPNGMAERVLRTFLSSWDPHRDAFSTLIRTGLASDSSQEPVSQMARDVVTTMLASALEGEERELRASLMVSQVIGLATMRYVVQAEPLASASIEEVVQLYAPAIQHLVDVEWLAGRAQHSAGSVGVDDD